MEKLPWVIWLGSIQLYKFLKIVAFSIVREKAMSMSYELIVPPQNSHFQDLIPSVTISADRAMREVKINEDLRVGP